MESSSNSWSKRQISLFSIIPLDHSLKAYSKPEARLAQVCQQVKLSTLKYKELPFLPAVPIKYFLKKIRKTSKGPDSKPLGFGCCPSISEFFSWVTEQMAYEGSAEPLEKIDLAVDSFVRKQHCKLCYNPYISSI